MKRIWMHLIVFASLVFPVVPIGAQDANAPTPTTAVCLIGDHPGIPESDAQTAALLVCDALRKQGISIRDPVYEVPASASVYRVVLRRLGEKIIVRLSHENPIGTIIIEQQLTLANIEEMIPAAPRLVEALVHGKPIDATADMENVTEQEARELRKISGESLWHIKIFGTFIPSTDIKAEPGYEFGWSYQTPSYAVGADLQTSGRDVFQETGTTEIQDSGGDSFSFFAWSIGGRYFFNKRNMSPYVGGGLAIVAVNYDTQVTDTVEYRRHWYGDEWESRPYGYTDSADDTGLGIYGVVGIEMLRLTQSRLNLELRLDRPLFTLDNGDIMPITFGISFSRNYVPGRSGCFLF